MKIATKSFGWTDPNAGAGVSNFYVYWAAGHTTPFAYELPKTAVPVVEGQTEYVFQLPGPIPLTEGEWTLWVAAADAEGNISDPGMLTRFFDFTAPVAPVNLRVL